MQSLVYHFKTGGRRPISSTVWRCPLRLYFLPCQISALEASIPERFPCRLGFCHNDLQYGNMMLEDPSCPEATPPLATPPFLPGNVTPCATSSPPLQPDPPADPPAASSPDPLDFQPHPDPTSQSPYPHAPLEHPPGPPRGVPTGEGSREGVEVGSTVQAEDGEELCAGGNIEQGTRPRVRLIDYEYAGVNPVAFDIANFW